MTAADYGLSYLLVKRGFQFVAWRCPGLPETPIVSLRRPCAHVGEGGGLASFRARRAG